MRVRVELEERTLQSRTEKESRAEEKRGLQCITEEANEREACAAAPAAALHCTPPRVALIALRGASLDFPVVSLEGCIDRRGSLRRLSRHIEARVEVTVAPSGRMRRGIEHRFGRAHAKRTTEASNAAHAARRAWT